MFGTLSFAVQGLPMALEDLAMALFQRRRQQLGDDNMSCLLVIGCRYDPAYIMFAWFNSVDQIKHRICADLGSDATGGTFCILDENRIYLNVEDEAGEFYTECLLVACDTKGALVQDLMRQCALEPSTDGAPGSYCARPYYGEPLPTVEYSIDNLLTNTSERSLLNISQQLYQQHPEFPITTFVNGTDLMNCCISVKKDIEGGIDSFTYTMGCDSTDSEMTQFDVTLSSSDLEAEQSVVAKVKYKYDADLWFVYRCVGVSKSILDRMEEYKRTTPGGLVLPCNTINLFDMLNATFTENGPELFDTANLR